MTHIQHTEVPAGVQSIYDGEVLLAQTYDLPQLQGQIFPTPATASLQFGFGDTQTVRDVEAHIHKRLSRTLDNTAEFLLVLTGQMTVEIFNEKDQSVVTIELTPHMALLQWYGGHRMRLHPGTRYLELKQGPYLGRDADKRPRHPA